MKVNFSTFAGMISGMLLIGIAVFNGGDIMVFFDLNSFFIAVGGTMAAVFIAFPFHKVFSLMHISLNAFKAEVHRPSEFIDKILELSTKYRMHGLKKLETEEETLSNDFLKIGVEMIVDMFEEEEIEEILEKEIKYQRERHEAGQGIVHSMAIFAPAFGMLGTIIGLIQMLAHLTEPEKLGPSMSMALVTTFYGVIMAYLLFYPLTQKLKTRTDEEELLNRVILEGLMGICRRDNARKLLRRMNALLPPNLRKYSYLPIDDRH